MNRKSKQEILDSIFFGMKLEVIEGSTDRAKEILSKAGVTLPDEDFALISGTYLIADETNRNGHRLAESQVIKALNSLIFKAANIGHNRSCPIGFYIDSTYDTGTKSMKSTSLIWKSQFPSEYAKIQEWISINDAGQSFELTFTDGKELEDGTLDLENVSFKGGAYLQRSKAACTSTDYVIVASKLDKLIMGGIKEDKVMDKVEILTKLETKDMPEADILSLGEEIAKLDVESKKEVLRKAQSLGLTSLVDKYKAEVGFTWDEVSQIEEALYTTIRKTEETVKIVQDEKKTTVDTLTHVQEQYTTAKNELTAKENMKYTEEDVKQAVIDALARDKKLRERREEIKADVNVKDEDLLDDVKFEVMKKDKTAREEAEKKEAELKDAIAERDLYKQKLTEAGIKVETGEVKPPVGGITPTPKEDATLAMMRSKTVVE